MKKIGIKRFVAFVLTAAMLMSLGAMAFAEGETRAIRIDLKDADGGQNITTPGAVYALYRFTGTTPDEWIAQSPEELYGEYTSDENGIVLADNLPEGEYRWVMVKAPDGYNVYNMSGGYMPAMPGGDLGLRAMCYRTTAPEEFTTERIAYIGGYPDGTVKPKDNITRAETAVILYRLLSDEVKAQYESSENTYYDLKDDAWYMTAIATLKNLGVIVQNGSHFEPSRPITRGEFAEWIYYFGGQTFYGGVEFSDDPGGGLMPIWERWQKYKTVAMHGWVQGYPDGSFQPDGLITRAEMMTIINRMMDRVPASAEDLPADMKTWSDNANPNAWFYLAVQEATNGIEIS